MFPFRRKKREMRVGDQAIRIVPRGLDPAEVAKYVTELQRYATAIHRLEHVDAMVASAERLVQESTDVAALHRDHTRSQAEELANQLVGAAQESKSTAEDILRTAREQAEEIRAQAQREAEMSIALAKERAVAKLKDDIRDIYDRLMHQLRDLAEDVHRIETTWVSLTPETAPPVELPAHELGLDVAAAAAAKPKRAPKPRRKADADVSSAKRRGGMGQSPLDRLDAASSPKPKRRRVPAPDGDADEPPAPLIFTKAG